MVDDDNDGERLIIGESIAQRICKINFIVLFHNSWTTAFFQMRTRRNGHKKCDEEEYFFYVNTEF